MGDSCLARFPHDDLWYKATIVDTHKHDVLHDVLQVMYDEYGEATHAIERNDAIPFYGQSGLLTCDSSQQAPAPTCRFT